MSVRYSSDRELLSRIHNEHIKLSNRKANIPTKTKFSNEEIQMANKYIKN
jgi:hypothetical protein